jgi:tetratricopeptide (TPR) repeat protein
MPGGDELLVALADAMNIARPEQGALLAADQLPDILPAELQPLAIAVTGLAVDGLRERAVSDSAVVPELARFLSAHAILSAESGRRDESVPLSEEAVTLFRELATADPTEYLPDLAISLNNHAVRLSEVGRRDEAVLVSEEAVALRRELVAADRTAYLPGLARSLNSYVAHLSEIGRRDDAARVSEEAVATYRELAAADRAAHLPGLVMSLDNYVPILTQTGRRHEAAEVSEEAVATYRELVAADRAAHLPDLAAALVNNSVTLTQTGRRDEAARVSGEAVAAYRELVGANRAVYLPDLPSSLHNHAIMLAQTGRRDEAVLVSEEAVTLRRELVAANRAAYLADLASSLHSHAIRLAETGLRDQAAPVSEEAVATYRELAAANRAMFLPDLAASLNNHAIRLTDAERPHDAMMVSQEAVATYRELAADNGAAHVPGLAYSLDNHAGRLAEVGRRDEAVLVSEEAVTLRRELVVANRAAHLPDLAMSLHNYSSRLAEVGRHDEAVAVSEDAVVYYREVAAISRAAYVPNLGMSLSSHAIRLTETGRQGEARDLLNEVLDDYADLPLGHGHILLARGRWHVTENRIADAVPDLTAAVNALTDAGDHVTRARVRRLLRRLREDDAKAFDDAWAKTNQPLPVWLRHPNTNRELARAVTTWIGTQDWATSKAMLRENATNLLTDTAEAALEDLIDANPASEDLHEHLALLRSVRVHGLDAAYEAHLTQLLRRHLIHILHEWLRSRSWAQSAAFATANASELLHPGSADLLDELCDQNPRDHKLRLHHGLLGYAAAAGFDAAYGYVTDAEYRRLALEVSDSNMLEATRLALARLHSGQSTDDPDAHFRLAVTTLLAGNPGEAVAAMVDCADHAAPYERRDFSRRLAWFNGQHPDLGQVIAKLQQILTKEPHSEPGS